MSYDSFYLKIFHGYIIHDIDYNIYCIFTFIAFIKFCYWIVSKIFCSVMFDGYVSNISKLIADL